MTTTIRDMRDGADFHGRTPESVTRTTWGRSAELRYSGDPNTSTGNSRQAMILGRHIAGAREVLAHVRVYPAGLPR